MPPKPLFEYNGSPAAKSTSAAPASGDPNQFLAALMQMLQQQPVAPPPVDFSSLFSAVRNDPQGDANKSYIAGHQGPGNPFDNGWFKTADQRHDIEASRGLGNMGPAVGVPQRTDAATNPYAFGPIGTSAPMATMFEPGPDPRMVQSGYQGMINPALPDATKYEDANFFSVQPGQAPLLPQGAVAGDGKTAYRRKKGIQPSSSSPAPGFQFNSLFR